MQLHLKPRKWAGAIRTVALGCEGRGPLLVGGGDGLPLHTYEGRFPYRPLLALEITDIDPPRWAGAVREPREAVLGRPAAAAGRAVEEHGADLVMLHLMGMHADMVSSFQFSRGFRIKGSDTSSCVQSCRISRPGEPDSTAAVRKPSAYPVLPMECVTVQEGGLVADPAAAQRVAPLVNLQDSFHDTVNVALGIHAARNGEPDEQQWVSGTDVPPACTP